MKKKVLFLMALLMNTGFAMADKITVGEVTIPQEGQATVVVNYQFDEAGIYSGWQFSLVLPEEVSTVNDDKGNPTFTTGSCYDSSYTFSSICNENTNDFVALSLQSSPMKGTSGILISIPIENTQSLSVGSTVNGKLQGIQFGNKDGVHTTFIDDVSFTITIGEPDNGRIKFDESSTSLPSYTANEKGDVSIKRTIKANEWNTIVLPFTLTKAKAEAAFGEDVQLAEFAGFEAIYADEDDLSPDAIIINLTNYTMTAKKGITGGKPYLIKTSKDIESFEADNVTLFREVTEVSKKDEYDTPGKLTGTLVKSKIPEDGLFINNNQFWYSTGKTNVKAFRAWFELGAVLNKDTNFEARVLLNFTNDETDGIRENKHELINNNCYYNLQGRRILSPSKGLYIRNGRKEVIK